MENDSRNALLGSLMKFCAYQERSEWEVRNKIQTLDPTGDETDALIRKLKEEHFIDDHRFAIHYVKSKLRLKGWGRIKLQALLAQKGIPRDIAWQVLAHIPEEEYEAALRQNREKWLKTHTLERDGTVKLYRFLLGKGFEPELIMKQINS